MSSGNMQTCANCGNEVREGARFCVSCGAPVVLPDQPPSSGEPPPITSSTRGRRVLWVAVGAAVALLLAGGAVAALLITGGDDSTPASLDSITNTTDVFPTNDATTTGADDATGQGVDETCADLLAFFMLAKEIDIARGGNSVDDIERLAAAASELASKAPAEPVQANVFLEGEPRDSLTRMAEAYAAYITLLAQNNMEPGPDALLVPEIATRLDLSLEESFLLQWFGARCSEDDQEELQELATG